MDGLLRLLDHPDPWVVNQAITVFSRTFPNGVTRADLATILRVGTERLAVLMNPSPFEITATSTGPPTVSSSGVTRRFREVRLTRASAISACSFFGSESTDRHDRL